MINFPGVVFPAPGSWVRRGNAVCVLEVCGQELWGHGGAGGGAAGLLSCLFSTEDEMAWRKL